MAAGDRRPRLRLPCSGLRLAGAGSPAAICRECRSRQTGSAPAGRLLVCLGDESPQSRGRHPALRRALEGAVRLMKKTVMTLIQIAVTVAVLFWVFHDPTKRAQMLVALRAADYRWVVAALLAYGAVELAAAARWYVLLKVQGIRLSISRTLALFFIGMFYNQFLPGGTGGDIIKTYLLLKETPGKG